MANPELQVKIGAVITDLERNLAKAQKSLQRFSDKSEKIGKKFAKTGKSMSAAISLPLAILGGVAIKTAADLETLETSLSVMTGSAEKGKAIMKDLAEFTAKTPFQLEGVGNTAKQLLAFGFTTTQVKENLQLLGDVAAGSGNDLGSLGQIFGQISAAGKLTGERLNQLQERAVPIGSALAKSMGVAESAIKDMVSEGKISFVDFEKAFRSLSSTGGIFEGAMIKQSNTIAGIFSTLKDNVQLSLGELGQTIVKAFDLKKVAKELITRIQNLTKWFSKLDDSTKKTIIKIAALTAVIGPLLVALGFLMTTVLPGLVTVFLFLGTTVIPAVIGAFNTLTTAMLANPIGLIIAAVAALTFGFITLLQRITPLVSKIRTFFNFIKSGGNAAKFSILQAESLALAFKEQDDATKAASEAAAQFKKDQDAAAAAAAKLTAELLKQAKVGGIKSRPKATKVGTKIATGSSGIIQEISPIQTAFNKLNGFSGDTIDGLNPLKDLPENIKKSTELVGTELVGSQKTISDAQAKLLLGLKQFNEEANEIIQNGIVNTFAGIGDAIGSALVNGGNVLKAAGSALLEGIGQIATRLGESAIGIGVAMLAIKLAFKNPFTAIAAGIALVALGSALGGIANRAINGSGGGGFSGDTGGSGSSTFTGSSVGTSNVGGGGGGTFVFEIAGTKLIGVLKNTLDRNSALGGSNNLIFG